MNPQDIHYFIQAYFDAHSLILPLGIIGLWRWSVWAFKEFVARWYRPIISDYKASVSIVTPVYNENPVIFTKALSSWKANHPTEIIAVIDYTDKTCIEIFKKFAKTFKGAKLIITKKPGKRPALADGILKARSEIVALVDSDTLWEKDVLKNGIMPFIDPKVGGVGTYQNVLKPKTLAQKIFDTQLDLRYCDEMPFLAAAGDALICLSGRTAFYRRKIVTPMLPDLVHETFMGKPVISGDDKRLTYLVMEAGWKLRFQSNSRVYTPGMPDFASYMKQRLRWSRNALRADLRALSQRWVWRHKALVFFQLDKVAQALVVLLSPVFMLVALINGMWLTAATILVWWCVSRTVKMYPHLHRRPQDITMLPAFILYSFTTGAVKLYAFFSLNTQGWITRWDSSRLKKLQFMQQAPAYIAAAVTMLLLILGVVLFKHYSYFVPMEKQQHLIASVFAAPSKSPLSASSSAGLTLSSPDGLRVQKYTIQPGEWMGSIAEKFGISYDTLLMANVNRITQLYSVGPGFVLNIPGKDVKLTPHYTFNYNRVYPDYSQIYYDATTNEIILAGRGTTVTLKDIQQQLGDKYLKEVAPKEWFLSANLSIKSGVTFNLTKDEITWLKLQSNKDKFVKIEGYNATVLIDGIKITSWDDQKNTYDTNENDKRSYILVKSGSRMDIYNSELAYLGFSRALNLGTSPYGVSWRMPPQNRASMLLTGEVKNSKFHNNYFGVYTYGATGMLWQGNEFYNNTRYGFDPHDDSNGALIEHNIAHNNGSHGFIISKRCVNNIFRDNISYDNKLHGIMLHEKSNNNIIEHNTLYGNTDGIAIWHSSNNLVRNNKIYNNKQGIRANAASDGNLIANNTIITNKQNGIYFYDNANQNIVKDNVLKNNTVAVYIRSNQNQIARNQILENKTGIYLLASASDNLVANNTLSYNYHYGIYSKINQGLHNIKGNNTLWRNRFDTVAAVYTTKNNLSFSE